MKPKDIALKRKCTRVVKSQAYKLKMHWKPSIWALFDFMARVIKEDERSRWNERIKRSVTTTTEDRWISVILDEKLVEVSSPYPTLMKACKRTKQTINHVKMDIDFEMDIGIEMDVHTKMDTEIKVSIDVNVNAFHMVCNEF